MCTTNATTIQNLFTTFQFSGFYIIVILAKKKENILLLQKIKLLDNTCVCKHGA